MSRITVVAVLILAIGCVLCRTTPERVLLTILAIGFAFSMPWIPLNLTAALTWVVLDRKRRKGEKKAHGWPFLSMFACMLLGLVAGIISALWVLNTDASGTFVLPFEKPPLAQALPVIACMAAANALGEELIWRGALYRASIGLGIYWMQGLQIVSFGMAHLGGIPGGATGVVMAGAFALVATAARSTWGLTSAVVLHLAADIVLFCAVFMSADSVFVRVDSPAG